MPILGIWASQNYPRSTDTGAYFPIGVATVGSGGAASIDFTSIPSTYTHLQIRGIARTTDITSGTQSLFLQFNTDTGSNYARHYLNGSGSAAGAGGAASQTSVFAGTTIRAGDTANTFAVNVIDILDYANTNKYKTTRSLSGVDTNGAGFVQFMSGLWQNTNAVTSIKLLPNNDNFAQYTQFALYGIKGA
jgi:hypothetical protein